MGYNNNHAGMHMIYYNRRNSCEDLEYYDRLAEKVRKKEENTQRLQSTEKTAESKNHIAGNVCENSNIQPQKSNKKEWENQNRNKHQKERPGKTKIIDDMYFRNTIDWYANIYLLAFERKLDIYDDICECEYLCEQDIRMSEKYLNSLEPITVIDKTSVFLNLLADRMGCDVMSVSLLSQTMNHGPNEYTGCWINLKRHIVIPNRLLMRLSTVWRKTRNIFVSDYH